MPRLLVRGRRLRPRARRATAHRAGVGEGGDLDPEAGGRGPRVGVDGLVLRRLPRLRALPLQGVLGGVLRRALPRAAGQLLGDTPACGQRHVPQLGPAAAASDLRGRAPGEGARDGALHPTAAAGAGDPDRLAPGRHAGTLARRRRARRAHPSVQGAAAEALLRRARRRAVRPDLRASRVLPDARRARDPGGTVGGAGGADRRGGAGRAGLGHGGQDARAAGRAERGGHARALRAGGRDREHGARLRRGAHQRVPGPVRARRDRRLRAPPPARPAARWAADRGVPGRHRRQLPAGQPPARAAQDRGPARARRTTC